jgi:hypothetical protein
MTLSATTPDEPPMAALDVEGYIVDPNDWSEAITIALPRGYISSEFHQRR